jgi:hypothetical protein
VNAFQPSGFFLLRGFGKSLDSSEKRLQLRVSRRWSQHNRHSGAEREKQARAYQRSLVLLTMLPVESILLTTDGRLDRDKSDGRLDPANKKIEDSSKTY